MDIDQVVAIIVPIIALIVTLMYAKRMTSTEHIYEMLEDISDEIRNDQGMQQKLYAIGALVGNGAAQGFGMKGKSGKFKMEDFIGMGAQWLFGQLGGTQPSTNEGQQPAIGQTAGLPWENKR
jgi:hypothetical protein